MRLPNILEFIDDLGQPESASADERLAIRLLVWMGVLMSLGGMLWGGISLAYGLYGAALVPLGYVVATLVNFTVFGFTRRFEPTRVLQLALSLLLPFLFQWALGGFEPSGVVMLWSLLSLVGSLTFSTPRETRIALGAFVVLTVVSGVLDASFAELAGRSAAPTRTTVFLVINLCAITSMVFGLTSFLNHRRQADNVALRDANQRISELNTELSRANTAKSAFLANMSHELRTPLNAVIGYAEMLEDAQIEDENRSDARRIVSAATHLLGLINEVLDVAKIESGTMEVSTTPFPLAELIHDATTVVAPQVRASSNRLSISEVPPAVIVSDPQKLRQVLVNLLGNAAKFTDHGTIRLDVSLSDDVLHVEVADTGTGMDPDILERVLQPFQQADASTTRRYGGTGLGLHIVDKLVRLLGGTLQLESVPGTGTTVRFSVPVELVMYGASGGPQELGAEA